MTEHAQVDTSCNMIMMVTADAAIPGTVLELVPLLVYIN